VKKEKVSALLGVCFLILILITYQTVLIYAEEPDSTSLVLPPSVMPVVILKGSDYEMGYQYGQQVGRYINVRKDTFWASALKNFNYEEILNELKAYEYYIKEYAPEEIEGMKGMADGASAAGYDVSYTDVLLLVCKLRSPGPNWTYPLSTEHEELDSEGCSVFSVWGSTTTDRSLICSKSSDASFAYQVAIVAFPDDGNNYLATAKVGHLAYSPSMNNKGLFIGSSAGGARRTIDKDYGLPPFGCGFQHLIRFSDNAAEAKDMVLSWKQADSVNITLSDVKGDSYVVETSAAFSNVRKTGDFGETDFIYATNNYFSDEGSKAISGEEFIEHAGWIGGGISISSIPRNNWLWTMFTRYQGKIDLDFVKMMWRVPGNSPPYPWDKKCRDSYYKTKGEGWDPKIGSLYNERIGIAIPDDGDEGVMYICTGPAGRVSFPYIPSGGNYYQISATHTFYQLALASTPTRVAEAAKSTAHNYIAEAYHKLMWLNYTDTGYSALNDLYSLANTEYYNGINWLAKASLASTNEMLLCLSKATTAFTRSQAHAKQVYQALVPPPTSPKDLNLKPYKDSKLLMLFIVSGLVFLTLLVIILVLLLRKRRKFR
jgi:hypothetical protein